MANETVARTVYGQIEGERIGNVIRFAGVQYADRIDGKGRLMPPRAPTPWSGVRSARTMAARVPQITDPAEVGAPDYHRFLFGPFHDVPFSEDGLYLNLWTPSLDRTARRPVMVWLHGGGFAAGGPTRAREDGSHLAERGDVVVVSPAHRLGAGGYMYLDQFGNDQFKTANLGMLDIIASLQWIADNIECFGGNPDNVTVFGESGGGFKVSTLLAMPRAKGLLHKAICQGGCFAPGFRFQSLDRDEAKDLTERLLAELGLLRDPAKLSDISMTGFIAAQQRIDGGLMAWRPVVDGEILPIAPEKAIANGDAMDIPLLIGCAAHEADFFIRSDMAVGSVDDLRMTMGDVADVLFKRYAHNSPDLPDHELYCRILSDWLFRVPAIRTAESRAAHMVCYMYLLSWQRDIEPFVRATHGSEVPFVFGTLEVSGFTKGSADARRVMPLVQDAWLAFAHHGQPNHPGIPHWPVYEPSMRATMILDKRIHIALDPMQADRLAWNGL